MTRHLLLTTTLVLLALCASLMAEPAVRTRLELAQLNPVDSTYVPLYDDTVMLVENLAANGYFLVASGDFTVDILDSHRVSITSQLITLGPTARPYSRRFTVEYGLPATIDHIEGKNGALYRFRITPISAGMVSLESCPYNHATLRTFEFTPSANADIYYVAGSLGEVYWNSVKELLEERYRRFADLTKYSLPGKFTVYLAPCPLYSIIWDKRFGIMVDPSKSTSAAIYTKEFCAADPFLLIQMAVMKQYGYAPPFLTEGISNYLTLANYDLQQLRKQKKTIPSLGTVMSTLSYLSTDPVVADRMAGSFVRFLVDKYKFETFLKAYRLADDLTLQKSLESVYGQNLASLEREWYGYLDTVSYKSSQFSYYADQAETKFDYQTMISYQQAALERAASRTDSVKVLAEVARGQFFTGNYYAASATQEKLVRCDSTDGLQWMAWASYLMMNGEYDSTAAKLAQAQVLDTSNSLIPLNIALNFLYRGNTDSAKTLLNQLLVKYTGKVSTVEARTILGTAMLESGVKAQADSAKQILREAETFAEQQKGSGGMISPAPFMWCGIAQVGLRKIADAEGNLKTALYFETRPFYQAMINLWLGKAADLRGRRAEARDFYGQVVAGAGAEYHQREARKLLESAYTQ